MKNKSFIRGTIAMLLLQMVLMISILLVFLYSSYRSSVENVDQILDNFLHVYGNELNNKIEDANMLLQRLIYKNTKYDMLQSESESDRYEAGIDLSNLLQESITNNNNVDMIVIAESAYQNCIDSYKNNITWSQKETIRDFAMDCAAQGHMKAFWSIKILEGTPFLYKMYVWNGKAAGVFMAVDNFMDTAGKSSLENMTILMTDKENQLYGYYGESNEELQIGQKIEKFMQNKNYNDQKVELADGNLIVHCYMNSRGFLGQIKGTMIIFFVIINITLVVVMILVKYLRKNILIPMKHMQQSMEMIRAGDYKHRIREEFETNEFVILKNTFNHLMDEVVGLKIQSYEKQIVLQETELRAIRLQIRPHFFLNAMTTISSLSMQKKNEQIKIYIDALTKNIRYMFKSGLHTVPLVEEVRHVENYFEMQELKYPGCVFYFMDIAPEVENWNIPQMLIHTVVENEYKYAVSLDTSLTILVKAGCVEINGEKMLSIEIEDDGDGYSKEFLEKFQAEHVEIEKDGTRVGLYSIRRMLEIMYERKNLFEISNIEPHGCLNRFLIPEHALHEMGPEKIQSKIE